VFGLENQLARRGDARRDQVFDNLGLAVNGDRLAGQVDEIEAMAPAVNAQLHAPVQQSFALHAAADLGGLKQLDRTLLGHAGADARLAIGAVVALEDDRVDAVERQQLREQQPRRPCADDANLGAHSPCSITSRWYHWLPYADAVLGPRQLCAKRAYML